MATTSDVIWAGIFGNIITALVFIVGPISYNENPFNMIPLSTDIQEGYADPSKIEMFLADEDNSGRKEHVFQYDGTNYGLRIDEQERPYFQSYSIKPSKKPEIVLGDYDSSRLESSVSDK